MRSYVNVTTFQRAKGPTCQCANVPISRCANGSTCQRASVPMCSQPPTRPTDPPITPTSLKLRRGKPTTDSHGSSGFGFAPACLSCVSFTIQQWRAGSLTAPPTHRPTDPPITPTSLKLRRGKPTTDSHGSSGFGFAPACLSCVSFIIQQWRAGSLTAPPTHRPTDYRSRLPAGCINGD